MIGETAGLFEQVQRGVFVPVLIVLALLFFACLLRAVKGPRVADRLVAVNMIGTMVMVMIAVLSLLLREEYLLDICLIYAMASFLAVIVLAKVYIGIYEEQHLDAEDRRSDISHTAGGNRGAGNTVDRDAAFGNAAFKNEAGGDTAGKEEQKDERLGVD